MIARFIVLAILLGAALLLNLCIGSVAVTPTEALNAIVGHSTGSGVSAVIWEVRLPRLLCAFAVGAALGISGYLLQSLSRNYLADPYLTGVSSGAAVAVAIAVILNAPFGFIPIAALTGGLVISLLVASMARTPSGLSITRLLLAGIAVSAVCSSIITLALSNMAGAGRIQALFYWLAGSINGKGWTELGPATIYISVGIIASLVLSKPLRVLSLGSASAQSLGMDVGRAQWMILLTAVVLCGSAVSLSGIVGFVGLVAPYLARTAFGRDERCHLVASLCLGGLLVLLSDLAARTMGGDGRELPLGTLLSLIGAPFFLWLVLKHRDEV